jgi:endonuclease/exonuclease/phosphatase family metal-dependent hydrolase
MERRVYLILIQVALVAVALFWACGGIQSPGVRKGAVYDYGRGTPPSTADKEQLTVLTWNISYGYGIGSSGRGYIPHSQAEFKDRLARIGKIIKDSGADIVFLQEVDFNSHRSYHINELEEIAAVCGLRYVAPIVSWQANYVPFPVWPIAYHFGAVSSGGVVLSRYPIYDSQVILHPKPAKNFWLRNMFYLFRYSQEVYIRTGSRDIIAVNNHLESYDKDNRVIQANILANTVEILDTTDYAVIVGGDMNTIPLEASKRYAYSDDKGGDFRDDATMEILSGISGLKEVIAPERYLKNESAFFTFPSNAPNRRLDYIFVPATMKVLEAEVLQVGITSDHLPVKAVLEWNYK